MSFPEVRDELYDDIFEKKQRIEMARHFTHLREAATIDNFLTGTSQSPPTAAGRTPAGLPGTFSKTDADELALPRSGTRQARAPASSGVVPATHAAHTTSGR